MTTSGSPPTAACSPGAEDVPDGPAGRRSRLVLTETAERRDPAARRRPAGRRLRRALLPRRHDPGLRPRDAVDLHRPAGLHAAARRRRDRHGAGADRGLRPVAERTAVQCRRLGGVLPRRRRRPARDLPDPGVRRRARPADRRRRVQRPAGGPRRQRPLRAALGLRLPLGAGAPGPGARRCRTRRSCRTPAPSSRCRAPCASCTPPPPTARGCSRGWCCPRAPPPSRRRRCCSGSTAAR